MRHLWLSEGNKTNTQLNHKFIQYRFDSLDNPELDMSPVRIFPRKQQKKYQSVSITPQTFRQTILTVLKEQFHLISPSFEALCLKWVQSDWSQLRTDIQSRLNKLLYLEPTLKYDTFTSIEQQVKIQWSKSLLLKGIHLLWNHWFKTQRLLNLEQIQAFYNSFCLFITKVSLYLYSNCLQNLISKNYPVENKLRLQTAVSIITENKEWTNIYNSFLHRYFIDQKLFFPQNYNFQNLEINPNILDITKKGNLFEETAKSIQSFTKALTLAQMVLNLKSFRTNLQRQIQYSIQLQLQEDNISQSLTVAKEDKLLVIIYVVIKHKLANVPSAMKYMNFLLNQEADKVMQWHKVDCWKANLQVACQFIAQPQIKMHQLKTTLSTNQS